MADDNDNWEENAREHGEMFTAISNLQDRVKTVEGKVDDLITLVTALNTNMSWVKWGIMLILGVVIAGAVKMVFFL